MGRCGGRSGCGRQRSRQRHGKEQGGSHGRRALCTNSGSIPCFMP